MQVTIISTTKVSIKKYIGILGFYIFSKNKNIYLMVENRKHFTQINKIIFLMNLIIQYKVIKYKRRK